MTKHIKCDIAIIGGGAGGLSIAAVAAQLNLNIVVIEKDKMGGDCLNYGCVPSKSLIAAAKSAHQFITAEKFGITPIEADINFSKVRQHISDVIATIAEHDSVERFTKLGATVIQEAASFIDDKTIQAGDYQIEARRIVIATGSSPFIPPIPGIQDVPYLTNETIFSLDTKPSHLLVIGGGPIGCELAQAFCFLGVKTTILEAFTIMPKDEPDMVDTIRQTFVKDGIDIHEQISIDAVKKDNDTINITFTKDNQTHSISGSHVLVSTGRRANISDLKLNNANIKHTERSIIVNHSLRTSNKRVYAIGDVAGSYQFTHIANYHAGIVIKNIIFKLPAKVNYRAIPWVTFTSPELAHTGLTELEAKKLSPNIKVIEVPFTENDRAQAERVTQGKIKVIVNSKSRVLGCSILGPNAGELILPWSMMIKDKKKLAELSDMTIAYPTFSEISKRVASAYYSPMLFSGKVRKLVNFLKYFG